MSTSSPVLTQAERFTQLVPTLPKTDPLDLAQYGAMFLICFGAPTATGAIGEDIPGPNGYDMEDCDITVYQFADGSLVWVVDTPDNEKHACLLGYYNEQYIQGNFVKPLGPVSNDE